MGLEDYKPIIVMIGCQILYAGTTVLSKAALSEGMSSMAFVFYRQFIAFLLFSPFALFSRRRSDDSCLGWKSFCWIFLLSFFSSTGNQNLYYEGLNLVSSSIASTMHNLGPAITFIMAFTIGLEKVKVGSLRSIAKIMGTVLCVIGAIALAVLKGHKLLNMGFQTRNLGGDDHDHQTWLIGCLCAFLSSCSWSLSLILQAHVTASYRDHVSLTAWTSLIAASQSGMLTLIIQPNMNAWKLTSPLQLFCCFYSGMSSAVTFFAQSWCISRRGPLFSAMFQPLCTVIVIILSCIFMHEELYTGSLIGGVIVIIGLYIVLWGKAKDMSEEVMKEETLITSYQDSDICRINLEHPLLEEKPAN